MTAATATPPDRTPSGTHAYVWGDNHHGALGLGHTARSATPRPAFLPDDLVMVAAGGGFTVGVTSAGAVWSWGSNAFGQLGDGTTTYRLTPTQVGLPAGTRVLAVVAGRYHTLALTRQGKVLAWGRNHAGQLGDGTTTDRHSPVGVGIAGAVLGLAAGDAHSLAVVKRKVLAWGGLSSSGAAGTPSPAIIPTEVGLPDGVVPVRVAAGGTVSAVLDTRGRVRAWGRHFGTPDAPTVLPRRAFDLDVGDNHVIAANLDGSLTSVGTNSQGELGDGTTTRRAEPVFWRLPGNVRPAAVRVAGDHAVALTAGGRAFTWGGNRAGYLGDGTTASHPSPIELVGLAGVSPRWLSVGQHHNVLLVRRGPAVRLRVSASNRDAGSPVSLVVESVDTFGSVVSTVRDVIITVDGQPLSGTEFTPATPGRYLIAASSGSLRGWTRLEIR